MTNNISKLDELKKLLLSEELEKLNSLELKLQKLDIESQDEETIITRLDPLFDRLLLERLQGEESETINILSNHLVEIIDKTVEKNNVTLMRSLQHIIVPSISKELDSNKASVVDTFYPIVGGMVTKYVANAIQEFVESINKKINRTFSLNTYTRKLKSYITGISEIELLLAEITETIISSLFIINKKNGLLICEAHIENNKIYDSHMIASMATAIKDFINDWILNHDSQYEVQMISYGKSTLYIESAGSVYIVAFLNNNPDENLKSNINAFFSSLLKKHMTFFQTFDGDDNNKEIQILSQKMYQYLNTQKFSTHPKKVRKTKFFMRYAAILIGFILIGYFFLLAKDKFYEHHLESIVKQQTGEKVDIKLKKNKIRLQGKLNSPINLYIVEDIVAKKYKGTIENNLILPANQIYNMMKQQEADSILNSDKLSFMENVFNDSVNKLKQKISLLEEDLSNSKNNLSMVIKSTMQEIERLNKQQSDIKKITQVRKHLVSKLRHAFDSNSLITPQNGSLDLAGYNLFDVGTSKINTQSKEPLKTVFEKYIITLMSEKTISEYIKLIVIEGYTDSSGSYMRNKELSQKRAQSVLNYLATLDIMNKYNLKLLMRAEGHADKEIIIIGETENKKLSRRIKIRFEIDKNKILNDTKDSVND